MVGAPLVSRMCLMLAPPLPMTPPTAARGTSMRILSSPSVPTASWRQPGAVLYEIVLYDAAFSIIAHPISIILHYVYIYN